jgi:hypothetical protein
VASPASVAPRRAYNPASRRLGWIVAMYMRRNILVLFILSLVAIRSLMRIGTPRSELNGQMYSHSI